jgi:CubicO group peptidase (beta-lactamase class C family)
MEKHSAPGLSVAISKDGRLVYARGFGLANKESGENVTPGHLFRIASVTKPITATTIFRLIECGRLRLSDKVFGPKGVLGTQYGRPTYRKYIEDIMIEHLLTYTAGGWPNDGRDPMFGLLCFLLRLFRPLQVPSPRVRRLILFSEGLLRLCIEAGFCDILGPAIWLSERKLG